MSFVCGRVEKGEREVDDTDGSGEGAVGEKESGGRGTLCELKNCENEVPMIRTSVWHSNSVLTRSVDHSSR